MTQGYTLITPSDPGVRDFSAHIEVQFRIDDDVFDGVPGIPALTLMEFGVLFDGLSERDIINQPDTFTRLFDLVLTDESAARFKARMVDKSHPVTLAQMMDILPWLMEKYGLRPSTPSSTSSAGLETQDDGTSSTVKQLEMDLTPSTSQRTAS